jgi:hypothetical protein
VNRDVWLWPDNDKPGLQAMQTLAAALPKARMVPLEKIKEAASKSKRKKKDGGESWDIADAIEFDGWDREKLNSFLLLAKREEKPEAHYGITPVPQVPPEFSELAGWFLANAKAEKREFAIQACFSLVSACAMGAYISETDSILSLYSLIVDDSGSGKDDYTRPLNEIISRIRVKHGDEEKSGSVIISGEMQSRQAIRSSLADFNIRYVCHGELGETLNQWNSGGPLERKIFSELLQLWVRNEMLPGLRTKDTKDPDIEYPKLGLCGGYQTESFEEMLGKNKFASSGFASRLDPVFGRPAPIQRKKKVKFPESCAKTLEKIMVKTLEQYSAFALPRRPIKEQVIVRLSKEASEKYDRYIEFCNERGESFKEEGRKIFKDLFSRCAEKSLRYSCLLAVYKNPDAPVVTGEQFDFAIDWVEYIIQEYYEKVAANGYYSKWELMEEAIVNHLSKTMGHSDTKAVIRSKISCIKRGDPAEVERVYAAMEASGVVKIEKSNSGGKTQRVTLLVKPKQSKKLKK